MAGKPGGQGPDQGISAVNSGVSGGVAGLTAGILRHALAAGDFAITAEIGPPRGASVDPVTRKAALLRDWVHAVNITDNQGANARLAPWAASLAAMAAGVEPIMQLTCRDRNRIALQSELLAASAVGIPNVVVMTGDHPRQGDHVDAKPVFDLDSTQLLAAARAMRDEGRLMSGLEVRPAPGWLLGAVTDPSGSPEAGLRRLAPKVAAGAQFVQTQFVFDVPAFAAFIDGLGEAGVLDRCKVLAGVGPLLSERAMNHLAGIPGVHIPDAVRDRLLAAAGGPGGAPEKFRAAGEELCAEIIAALAEVPGVAGLHVMSPGGEGTVPGILERAGLRPRRAAGVAGGDGHPGGPAHAD